MNPTQVAGLFRDIGKFIAMFVASKGIIDGGMVELLGGIIAFAGLAAWSYYTNKTTTMIAAVAQSDEVKKVVVTDPAIAIADPSPKVVKEN